jgi:hypothetical protein
MTAPTFAIAAITDRAAAIPGATRSPFINHAGYRTTDTVAVISTSLPEKATGKVAF